MRLSPLFLLLICGLVGGMLAVATLPNPYLPGLAGAWLNSLPRSVQTPPSQQSSYAYANDGKTLMTTFYDQNRRNVDLTEIGPVMQQAIVAAEDTWFYQHDGVDLKCTLRALVSDVRTGRAGQGGSTLTMQYVRNVLKNDPTLTPQQHRAATAGTPLRKLQEMRYAAALEKKLPKPEILDRYLNIAYFGNGAYGIDAASHSYFNAHSPYVTRWPAGGDGSYGGHWCPVDANPAWMDGQRTMWGGYGRSITRTSYGWRSRSARRTPWPWRNA